MNKLRYTYNLFRILKRKLSRNPDSVFTLQTVLEKNYEQRASFNFILAGANDGISHDFLYEFLNKRNSKGIAIEPVFEYYTALVKNYSHLKEVITVNKAIHANLSKVVIYKVDPKELPNHPAWASGIASLDPEHHKKSQIPSNVIIQDCVDASSLMDIITEYYSNPDFDYVQIDTEGFDFEILKQIDFDIISPAIICFEYINLSVNDRDNAIRLLKKQGYYCFYNDINIAAVKLNKIKL